MHDHSHDLTLGISFLLGAIHALEPGHGKTAMLVYLAGGKRNVWHPIVMGLSTAVTHSVSLMAIAGAVHLAHHMATGDHHHETQVSAALQWLSALLVIAVGLWMLLQARRGNATRCCGHHHHDHGHTHEHDRGHTHDHAQGHTHGHAQGHTHGHDGVDCSGHSHAAGEAVAGRRDDASGLGWLDRLRRGSSYSTTALLGVAVGLLPCPSALAAYFTGLSAGNPASAYLIIGLFALGIASSLTVVGVALQRFGRHFGSGTGRLAAMPWPLVRALIILGIGTFYTLRLTVA